MSQRILKALMQLFAIIARVDEEIDIQNPITQGNGRNIVQSFLKQELGSAAVEEYLKLFDEFLIAIPNEFANGNLPPPSWASSILKNMKINTTGTIHAGDAITLYPGTMPLKPLIPVRNNSAMSTRVPHSGHVTTSPSKPLSEYSQPGHLAS